MKHNILTTSRLSLLQGLLLYTLAFKLPHNQKYQLCWFRSGEEFTIPCLSFFHQKHFVNRTCHGSDSYLPPLAMKARVQPHSSPRGICGGQSVAGSGFYPSPSTFPCHHYFTSASYSFIHPSLMLFDLNS